MEHMGIDLHSLSTNSCQQNHKDIFFRDFFTDFYLAIVALQQHLNDKHPEATRRTCFHLVFLWHQIFGGWSLAQCPTFNA